MMICVFCSKPMHKASPRHRHARLPAFSKPACHGVRRTAFAVDESKPVGIPNVDITAMRKDVPARPVPVITVPATDSAAADLGTRD